MREPKDMFVNPTTAAMSSSRKGSKTSFSRWSDCNCRPYDSRTRCACSGTSTSDPWPGPQPESRNSVRESRPYRPASGVALRSNLQAAQYRRAGTNRQSYREGALRTGRKSGRIRYASRATRRSAAGSLENKGISPLASFWKWIRSGLSGNATSGASNRKSLSDSSVEDPAAPAGPTRSIRRRESRREPAFRAATTSVEFAYAIPISNAVHTPQA